MSAIHGRQGAVTWSTMTHLDTNVNSWTLDYAGDEEEVTSFGDPTNSAPYPREYIPGLTQWSGSYEARLDSSPANYLQPSDVNTTDYIRLDTGEGNTIYKGSAFITGWNPTAAVDGIGTVSVSFRGTKSLAISDTS